LRRGRSRKEKEHGEEEIRLAAARHEGDLSRRAKRAGGIILRQKFSARHAVRDFRIDSLYEMRVILLLQIIYRKGEMEQLQSNLLQGTLHMLILKALSLGEMHGLGISRRIEQITRGTFQVKPGSLFPALHRMEEAGWLSSEWGESENNRRAKYYRLSRAGRKQLEAETKEWDRITLAIASALGATLGEV
jgi:transcriptional regulator